MEVKELEYALMTGHGTEKWKVIHLDFDKLDEVREKCLYACCLV
jgi:hypothetical protein